MTSTSGPKGQIDLKLVGRMIINQHTKFHQNHVNFILFLIDLTWNAPTTTTVNTATATATATATTTSINDTEKVVDHKGHNCEADV